MRKIFNWYTDEETVAMLKELAEAHDRKPAPYLKILVKQEYTVFKRQQAKEL